MPGSYFFTVLRRAQDTDVSQLDYQGLLWWSVAATIAAIIAKAIGTHVSAEVKAHTSGTVVDSEGAEREMRRLGRTDARDKQIHRFGEYVGGIALGAGAVGAMVLAMTEADHFWIANTLYATLVLAGVVAAATKIIVYRRGL